MFNIAILVLLMSPSFSYTVAPSPISVQEDVSFTLYAIYSARDSTSDFETVINHFWSNISDEVRNLSYDNYSVFVICQFFDI
jgi:hypothetical protein